MHKYINISKKVVILLLFYFIVTAFDPINIPNVAARNSMENDSTVSEKVAFEEIIYKNIQATVYHPVVEQTDNTPLITADNSKIDTTRINELRWIAVSRDLLNHKTRLRKYNGKLKLRDTVWVSYDKAAVLDLARKQKIDSAILIEKYDQIVGWWVVKDVMGDYYWHPEKININTITQEMIDSKEYKIKKGKAYKKYYQRQWIDFLQHPKTGMLDYWTKCIIITKKVKTDITLN